MDFFRLPTIHVPLRESDSDVSLDLQALLDECYRNGGYDDIDYTSASVPSLSAAEARWANRLLRKSGRRPAAKARKKK